MPPKVAPHIPTEEELLTYFQKYSNWGRWGKDDQKGTLNFITPDVRKRAAALVRDGHAVSCARVITTDLTPDAHPPVHPPATHFMVQSGEQFDGKADKPGVLQTCLDYFGMVFHSPLFTHLDAVGHVFWSGKMYNGFPAGAVTAYEGATVQSVDLAKDVGITRGVLLDIPRLRGVKWIEPPDAVYAEDLLEAERAQGVKVQPGDALLIRTGYLRRRNEEGPWNVFKESRIGGLHANAIPFIHERGVALLGRDSGDARGYKLVFSPIHQIGIVALGLWLIDYVNLEELAQACAERQRWEFLFTMNPLRIHNGTGSPLNPVAVL
ncbi:MAG: cyclase family protein [Dehalococcoidia bacterium]|nr:cyclase family protein [Dehalococcoidia bacterium]